MPEAVSPPWKRRELWLDSLRAFFLAALLIYPLFTLGYRTDWSSIEPTFIADARFLGEHWPPPKWHPNWYCGTRVDYVYPPLIRYGPMLVSRALGLAEVRAYHLYVAVIYSLGIAAVYLLVRIGSGSRWGGWLAAAATALLSPSLLLIKDYRLDAVHVWFAPVRLNVLVRYGEGPHISAFSLIPLALAAAWPALRQGDRRALAVASIFSALVVSHNFYGATALAIFFPIMVWAVWISSGDLRTIWRAAVIAVLSYGLCALWLVPSYFWITNRNLMLVAQPGNRWSLWLALGVTAVYALVTWKLARGRAERAWMVFLAGVALFFTLNVAGHYFFGFRVTGEPLRHVPELDLALILLAAELLRRLWNWSSAWVPPLPSRVIAAAIVAASFMTAKTYLRHAWDLYEEDRNAMSRVEYRMQDWMKRNMPDSRALTTGSVRFWYNVWNDLPQVGGGSEQGLINLSTMTATLEAAAGESFDLALAWLQAMAADAIIVHDKSSTEAYHDYPYPEKFKPLGPAMIEDEKGNFIYRIPRRFPARARVVETQAIRAIAGPVPATDLARVRAYADVLEKGPDSEVKLIRRHPDSMRLEATVGPGQALAVQESFDPNWRAFSGGVRLKIEPDVMGFLLISLPPGRHTIEMQFPAPFENQVGRLLWLLSVAAAGWLWIGGKRREPGTAA